MTENDRLTAPVWKTIVFSVFVVVVSKNLRCCDYLFKRRVLAKKTSQADTKSAGGMVTVRIRRHTV